MSIGTDLSPLQNAWQQAQSIVCFIHPQSTYDAVAAALAVQMAAEQDGKSASVVCEAPMRSEYRALVGLNKVEQEAGNRNLVISFPYQAEQVDKVSYNVNEESGRFELIIAPKSGHQALTKDKLHFTQSGLSADIVLLFGFHGFDELGEIYEKEQYTIEGAFTVAVTQGNIDRYAKLHVALQPNQLSYSEWVTLWLQQAELEIQRPMANNLLSGIEYATAQLQDISTARTFETVAALMRAGAQRMPQNPAFDFLATPIRDPQASVGEVGSNSIPNMDVLSRSGQRSNQSSASNTDQTDVFNAQQRHSGEQRG